MSKDNNNLAAAPLESDQKTATVLRALIGLSPGELWREKHLKGGGGVPGSLRSRLQFHPPQIFLNVPVVPKRRASATPKRLYRRMRPAAPPPLLKTPRPSDKRHPFNAAIRAAEYVLAAAPYVDLPRGVGQPTLAGDDWAKRTSIAWVFVAKAARDIVIASGWRYADLSEYIANFDRAVESLRYAYQCR